MTYHLKKAGFWQMKRIAKIDLTGTAAGLVLLLVGVSALAYFLVFDVCGNDPVAEFVSPDTRAMLVVFQRDCGATTDFSTQASLVKANARLPVFSGNLFVADTNHGIASSGPGGGPELRVRWEGPKRLLLQHHAKVRVFKAEQLLNGIEVRYETFP